MPAIAKMGWEGKDSSLLLARSLQLLLPGDGNNFRWQATGRSCYHLVPSPWHLYSDQEMRIIAFEWRPTAPSLAV